MRITGQADSVNIDSDEDGFVLVVETNVGEFAFNIHHLAEAFAANVNSTIGAWLREGEAARASYVPRITEEDLQGYNASDPKRYTLEQEMNA